MVGTLEDSQKPIWNTHISPFAYAYNVTTHDITVYFLYNLMFCRYPKLAIDAPLELPGKIKQTESKNEYARKLRERLSVAYKRAKEAALETRRETKRRYDVSAKARLPKRWDYVLVRYYHQRQTKLRIGGRILCMLLFRNQILTFRCTRSKKTVRTTRRQKWLAATSCCH